MKKGLLSLLALALTVVGCQNYDDQFEELTSQITSLQSTVDGLTGVSSAITSLQSTVSGLSSTLGSRINFIREKPSSKVRIIYHIVMNKRGGMDQFYYGSTAISSFVDLALIEHFSGQKDKHGTHLLPFTVNNKMGNTI